jgi:hypothetical protein
LNNSGNGGGGSSGSGGSSGNSALDAAKDEILREFRKDLENFKREVLAALR